MSDDRDLRVGRGRLFCWWKQHFDLYQNLYSALSLHKHYFDQDAFKEIMIAN